MSLKARKIVEQHLINCVQSYLDSIDHEDDCGNDSRPREASTVWEKYDDNNSKLKQIFQEEFATFLKANSPEDIEG